MSQKEPPSQEPGARQKAKKEKNERKKTKPKEPILMKLPAGTFVLAGIREYGDELT